MDPVTSALYRFSHYLDVLGCIALGVLAGVGVGWLAAALWAWCSR